MNRKALKGFSFFAAMTLCFACTNEASDEQNDTPSQECSDSDCNNIAPEKTPDTNSEDDS